MSSHPCHHMAPHDLSTASFQLGSVPPSTRPEPPGVPQTGSVISRSLLLHTHFPVAGRAACPALVDLVSPCLFLKSQLKPRLPPSWPRRPSWASLLCMAARLCRAVAPILHVPLTCEHPRAEISATVSLACCWIPTQCLAHGRHTCGRGWENQMSESASPCPVVAEPLPLGPERSPDEKCLERRRKDSRDTGRREPGEAVWVPARWAGPGAWDGSSVVVGSGGGRKGRLATTLDCRAPHWL